VKRAALLWTIVLALAPAARAGGDFVDLAAGERTEWFVGSFGVRGIDAGSGRLTASFRAGAYPLSVAVAGRAVWVASVANGFVDGRLTRIDPRTGRWRVVLHVAGSVQYVARGARGVYALVGEGARTRVVSLDDAGQVRRVWVIPTAGRLAADSSGCWISTNTTLLHADPAGRLRVVLHTQLGDVATGGGAVWLPGAATITRVDEHTLATRVLRTGRLRLGGFQHDVAVGAGALWTLDMLTPALQRRDAATGKLERSVRLPDLADAVVATPTRVWVGVAISHQVLAFDPRTLRRLLDVQIG